MFFVYLFYFPYGFLSEPIMIPSSGLRLCLELRNKTALTSEPYTVFLLVWKLLSFSFLSWMLWPSTGIRLRCSRWAPRSSQHLFQNRYSRNPWHQCQDSSTCDSSVMKSVTNPALTFIFPPSDPCILHMVYMGCGNVGQLLYSRQVLR